MAKIKFDFDLIVVGSGPASHPAVMAAAGAGAKVAIVESGTIGGGANRYDVPISALARVAEVYADAKKGSRFGISSSTLRFNFPAVLRYQDIVTKRTSLHAGRQFYEKLGIQIYHGHGQFLSPHLIAVGRRQLTARNFLIAAGSKPSIPDVKNLDNVGYLTPRDLADLRRLPKSIFVIGGGATGVEVAQIFAQLGSQVFIADSAANLLPREEPETGQLLGKMLDRDHGATVLTKSKVVAAAIKNGQKQVTFKRGGEEKSVLVDEIIVAAGQAPNLDLGLDNAGVRYHDDGIKVNEYLQTSMKHIYAAGDCIGGKISVSKAAFESQIIAFNILHRAKQMVHYNGLPYFTYTSPQVASVGLTEAEVKDKGIHLKKSIQPLSFTARSNVDDFKDGFVKLVANHNGKLLGAAVVAPEAGSIIHELAVAIRHDLLASDLAETPHAYLSWNEAIKQAAAKLD